MLEEVQGTRTSKRRGVEGEEGEVDMLGDVVVGREGGGERASFFSRTRLTSSCLLQGQEPVPTSRPDHATTTKPRDDGESGELDRP